MRHTLTKERDRADRTHHEFCLAAFRPSDASAGGVAALVRILRERSRLADEIGFLADGRLAVLLYNTGAAGARRFADAIRAAVRVPLDVAIYVYRPGGDRLYELPSAGPDRSASDDSEGPGGGSRIPASEDAANRGLAVEPLRRLASGRSQRWGRGLDVAGAIVGLLASSPIVAACGAT